VLAKNERGQSSSGSLDVVDSSVVNRPVRPERGRNGAVFLRPDGDGRKDGRRRRSLSANNKNYTEIISITILTVMQDL